MKKTYRYTCLVLGLFFGLLIGSLNAEDTIQVNLQTPYFFGYTWHFDSCTVMHEHGKGIYPSGPMCGGGTYNLDNNASTQNVGSVCTHAVGGPTEGVITWKGHFTNNSSGVSSDTYSVCASLTDPAVGKCSSTLSGPQESGNTNAGPPLQLSMINFSKDPYVWTLGLMKTDLPSGYLTTFTPKSVGPAYTGANIVITNKSSIPISIAATGAAVIQMPQINGQNMQIGIPVPINPNSSLEVTCPTKSTAFNEAAAVTFCIYDAKNRSLGVGWFTVNSTENNTNTNTLSSENVIYSCNGSRAADGDPLEQTSSANFVASVLGATNPNCFFSTIQSTSSDILQVNSMQFTGKPLTLNVNIDIKVPTQ